MSRTALFVSPHLDDVAFSCGGALADLADRGWRTVLATVFTATVLPVEGFALACQLDKGLAPDVDYMALRREEDREAASILGAAELHWLDLPEAPHRGYRSAPELFAEIRAGDEIWREAASRLGALMDAFAPDKIFAPQGLGGHVDHRQVIRAVQCLAEPDRILWYRDTPYAIRNPDAAAFVPAGPLLTWPIAARLERKLQAACAYRSQVGFQFGGPESARAALAAFAEREGGERFFGSFGDAPMGP